MAIPRFNVRGANFGSIVSADVTGNRSIGNALFDAGEAISSVASAAEKISTKQKASEQKSEQQAAQAELVRKENEALSDAATMNYTAGIVTGTSKAMSAAELASGGDPVAFAEAASGAVNSTASNLPQEMASKYAALQNVEIQARAEMMQDKAKEQVFEQALQSMGEALGSIEKDVENIGLPKTSAQRDLLAIKSAEYSEILSRSGFSPAEQAKKLRGYQLKVSSRLAIGGLEEAQDKSQFIKEWAENASEQGFLNKQEIAVTTRTLIAHKNSIEALDKEINAEAAAQESHRKAMVNADFRVRLATDGEAITQRELDTARDNGDITPSQWATHSIELVNKRQRGTIVQQDNQRVANAISGEAVLDFRSKQDRSSANSYYENKVVPTLEGLPSDVRDSAKASFFKQTGILPESIKTEVRGKLYNGSAEQQVQAAQLFARLQEAKPELVKAAGNFSAHDVARAELIVNGIRAGAEPEDVLANVDRIMDPNNQAGKISRQNEVNNIGLANFEDRAAEALNLRSVFTFGEEVPTFNFTNTRLANDYKNLYEQQYLLTGDEDLANKYASEAIKNTWSVTTIGGRKRTMKFAPEAVYGEVGANNEWINLQFLNDMKSELGQDVNEEDFFLGSDNMTARQATAEAATYPVFKFDEAGVPQPLFDKNGNSIRWAPNRKEYIDAENKRSVEKARRERNAISKVQNFMNTIGADRNPVIEGELF